MKSKRTISWYRWLIGRWRIARKRCPECNSRTPRLRVMGIDKSLPFLHKILVYPINPCPVCKSYPKPFLRPYRKLWWWWARYVAWHQH